MLQIDVLSNQSSLLGNYPDKAFRALTCSHVFVFTV